MASLLSINIQGIPFNLSGLKKWEYFESLEGCAWYSILFSIDSWSLLEQFYSSTVIFNFQASFGGTTNQSPLKKFMLGRVGAVPYSSTMIDIQLEGFDAGYRMNENCSQECFSAQTVSEMVTKLAANNNLIPQVTKTNDTFNLPQGCMTDAQFITEVLLPRAYTPARSDFFFYIQDGSTLVFQPINYTSPVKDFHFFGGSSNNTYSDGLGQVDIVSMNYNRSSVIQLGGFTTKVRAFNPSTKSLYEFKSSENSVPYTPLAKNSIADSDVNIVTYSDAPFPLKNVNMSQVDGFAKKDWFKSAYSLFDVTLLLTPGDLTLRVGTVVRLTISLPGSPQIATDGRYLVGSIKHMYEDGVFRSYVCLLRRNYAN